MPTLTIWLWPMLVSSLGERDESVREEAMRLLARAPRAALATREADPEIAARVEILLRDGRFENWCAQYEAGRPPAIPKDLADSVYDYLLGIAWSRGIELRQRCRAVEFLAATKEVALLDDLIALLWEPGEQVMHGR